MENKVYTLAELRELAEVQAKAYNTAIFEKNFEAMANANASLEEIEKEYLAQVQNELFKELKATENPMLEAIKRHSFMTIRHVDKTDKDTNVVTREIDDKERQIDLLRFDQFCVKSDKSVAHDPLWSHTIQCFNQLMCLRAARELKCNQKEIDKISKSYYMSEKAKEISMGKTPDSNTQILKQLQICIDAIIYEDNGKGRHKNFYGASSKDVAYLIMLYTKRGKKALSVTTANHSTMRNLIADICHRIVTEKEYSLEYKEEK